MKRSSLINAATLFFLSPHLAFAQGDGPRTYMLVPDDTQVFSQFYIHLNGNQTATPGHVVPNGDLDVDLLVSMYTRTFELNGKQGAFFGLLPMGRIDGSLSAGGASISGSSQGLGDLTLGGIWGVINSPNLSPKDYASSPATPNLGVLAKLTIPTGKYDSSQSLNIGANRWALQVGFPMAAYIGKSMTDPRLTSFELFPSATFFSDNNAPGGGASSTSQDVLYKLEAHITHNLSRSWWVSLDAEQIIGGETSADGVRNGDRQKSLGLGVTANYSFNASSFLKVTYGKTVDSNTAGSDGNLLRIQLGYVF